MLEVRMIENGIVIDHIKAGNGIKLFNKLDLLSKNCPTVLLMNVESRVLGRKDIIKIENTFDVDLNLLGLIDNSISINIIKNSQVIEKRKAGLPSDVNGLIECKNPRCITNSDIYIKPTFILLSKETLEYKCEFCDEITKFYI